MQLYSQAQELTANNLANLNTPGFKADKLFFRMLTEEVDGKTMTRTEPMLQISLEQGELESTGNDFDFAIDGPGFFMVEEEGQMYLTRNGRFNLDSDGFMRNENGAYVIGESGKIHLPGLFHTMSQEHGGTGLEVAKDGTIRLNDEVYDRMRIVGVDDPSKLQRRGNSLFSVDQQALGPQDSLSSVMQGYFEKGNVQALSEMTDMMRNMQMFEAQQRAMHSTDEMLSQASQTLGRF